MVEVLMPQLMCIVLMAAWCATATAAAQQTAIENPALRAFLEQVDREWPGESRQQSVTVESLTLLASTVESIAKARQKLTPDIITGLDRLRTETHKYERGVPSDLSQSTQLQHVLITAADVLRRLAGAGADTEPERSRLAALKRSAESLDRRAPLRRQPDVIERFFHQAAELLRDLAARQR
jgi:hypothetical protein